MFYNLYIYNFYPNPRNKYSNNLELMILTKFIKNLFSSKLSKSNYYSKSGLIFYPVPSSGIPYIFCLCLIIKNYSKIQIVETCLINWNCDQKRIG